MATVSVSRRAASGIALIVAGALFLLAVLLPLVGVSLGWLLAIAFLVIAVALGILGIGAVNNTVAKVSLVAAAVGWLILAINALGLVALPGVLVTIAALVAGIGGLLAAVVLLVGREIANTSALLFIVATALGLLYLLGLIGTLPLGQVGTVVAFLFGAALVVTGVVFRMPERRRGR